MVATAIPELKVNRGTITADELRVAGNTLIAFGIITFLAGVLVVKLELWWFGPTVMAIGASILIFLGFMCRKLGE